MNKKRDTALNWATIAMLLKDMGYRYIGAYFEGSGDSGYIEAIIAHNNKEELENNISWSIEHGTDIKDLDIPHEMRKFIERSFDNITASQDDWWNNEGGNGHSIIDLADNSYTLNIDVRVTEYINNSYNKKLIE